MRYLVITLGTTCTTRKETLESLHQMGLTLPHAQNTMIKLHKNAIDSEQSIFRARRIREWEGLMDPPCY